MTERTMVSPDFNCLSLISFMVCTDESHLARSDGGIHRTHLGQELAGSGGRIRV
jgi:hypothetical protein